MAQRFGGLWEKACWGLFLALDLVCTSSNLGKIINRHSAVYHHRLAARQSLFLSP